MFPEEHYASVVYVNPNEDSDFNQYVHTNLIKTTSHNKTFTTHVNPAYTTLIIHWLSHALSIPGTYSKFASMQKFTFTLYTTVGIQHFEKNSRR